MRLLLSGLTMLFGLISTTVVAAPTISDAYARATPPGAAVGAVYFKLHNQDNQADRLLRADSPVAERTEIHTHTMTDGVARMHEVPAIELPPGEVVTFQPGGYHIMLIELTAPLTAGETLPLTLTFELAGEVSLTVPIRKITSLEHQHDH